MQYKPSPTNIGSPNSRGTLADIGLAAILMFASLVALPDMASASGQPIRGSDGWILSSHPCPGGNRTDALQMDDDGTLWVGCGTNAEGYGLFASHDGGLTWSAANVTPSTLFNSYRVSSISRGHDGALYVAGISSTQGTGQMVLRVDTSVSPSPISLVLSSVPQVGRAFHVGNYRELPTGEAIAEDLNGYSLLYRPTPSTGTSAADWTQVDTPYQILNMTLTQDRENIVAAGSRIIEPPRVFLPPTAPPYAPWDFETLALPTAFNWKGELWGIAVTHNRLYAVGVDQDSHTGKIFLSGSDPYVAADYEELSFPDLINPGSGTGTWARGVCAYDNTVVVVGERFPLNSSSGLILMSTNAGQSFTDVTPVGVGSSVSKCALLNAAGPIVAVGSAGFVAILAGDVIYKNGFDPSM